MYEERIFQTIKCPPYVNYLGNLSSTKIQLAGFYIRYLFNHHHFYNCFNKFSTSLVLLLRVASECIVVIIMGTHSAASI